MTDQQLREQFKDWARPLRGTLPPPLTVIRRRARRRTARLAASAGSALAVTGLITGLVVSGLPFGSAPAWPPAQQAGTRARYPFPPGQPYLITLPSQWGSAVIQDQATGRALRVIAPAPHHAFRSVTAAADDRLFVLADEQEQTGVTRLYAVRLGAGGRVASWRLVPRTTVSNRVITGLAVSPDGTEVGVATVPRFPATGPVGVTVYGLSSTVAPRSWVAQAGQIGGLSWADDAHLAFNWNGPGPTRSGLRILATTLGPAGAMLSLLDRSLLAIPQLNQSGSAQVTADGSTVLIPVPEGSLGAALSRMRLGEFSAASGRLLRWLPLGTRVGTYCGVLWTSRTGSRLFTQCGHVQQSVIGGAVTRIRLPVIKGSGPLGGGDGFAW